jgi:hypothetical protein
MATQPNTAVAIMPNSETERFNLMQREAKIFAYSPLIPEHLRKGGENQAIANCYIALKLAKTMGEDPLVVLQNIHIVSGKAGFSAQYMIARANAAGIFKGRIDWRIDRTPGNLAVTAYAVLKDTGQEVSVTCDMAMAKAEGWDKNPKYRSMPEVMLRYRSATFLVRFYAPDVMLGYQTAEEVTDLGYASGGPDLNAAPLTAGMIIDQSVAEDVAPIPVGADAIADAHQPEGRADEDHGDQHDGTEPEAPVWLSTVNDVLARIDQAATRQEVSAAEAEYLKHAAALPDDQVARIEAALRGARRKAA